MGTCLSVLAGGGGGGVMETDETIVDVPTDCTEDQLHPGRPTVANLVAGGDSNALKKCVLVRESDDGPVRAVALKCSHYGASLANGAYGNGVIRCPWHGACFSVTTGDLEDFPGLDDVHAFETKVEEGKVVIRATRRQLRDGTGKRAAAAFLRDPDNNETIVVVGGGAAGQVCVETLRRDGRFTGRLLLVTRESDPPYDRPKLSKALTSSAADLALRKGNFYDDRDIELRTSEEATALDVAAKQLTLESGEKINYDKIILATGSSPRVSNVPGGDLLNVMVLRTPEDANSIAAAAKKSTAGIVIIGTSFIGMEVAASLAADKGVSATISVVGSGVAPFHRSLGPEIGRYLQGIHEQKGVKFIMNSGISAFHGKEGRVEEAQLKGGESIPADLVVLGIGAVPNTAFLKDSGIDLTPSGHVKVDEMLQVEDAPGVFAAGDIAEFPLSTSVGSPRAAIGHWQLASAHGRCAALNAIGANTPLKTVPFFWTAQFGKSVRYAGYAPNFDDVHYDGEVSSGQFVAFYCQGSTVAAVATLGRDPVAARFANLLAGGKTLLKENIGKWLQDAEDTS